MTYRWFGFQMTDPNELETRFSTEDSLYEMGIIYEEPSDEDTEHLEALKEAMERIPTLEADFIDLYHFKGRNQEDIAKIFNVSQPTVSYRLKRSEDRIQFLIKLPKVDEKEIRENLKKVLTDPLNIDIMVIIYETTSQSATARRLGVSQGKVRYRFNRALDKISKHEGLEKYKEIYELINSNLAKLTEVKKKSKDDQISFYIV